MKKNKSKKSNPANQEDNASLLITIFWTKSLMERLSACLAKLEDYGDIPSFRESCFNIIKEYKTTGTIDFSKCELIEFDDLSFILEKPSEEIINIIIEEAKQINIHISDSLASCIVFCMALLHLYKPAIRILLTEEDKIKLLIAERVAFQNAHEALGYWTAKLEEMKRNKKSVKKRTDTKEDYKAKLKEMLKTMSKKECRIEAQAKFKVTDRTILNYLKEIKEEKTAILRKNKDIA
jgi:hypothetical protein